MYLTIKLLKLWVVYLYFIRVLQEVLYALTEKSILLMLSTLSSLAGASTLKIRSLLDIFEAFILGSNSY